LSSQFSKTPFSGLTGWPVKFNLCINGVTNEDRCIELSDPFFVGWVRYSKYYYLWCKKSSLNAPASSPQAPSNPSVGQGSIKNALAGRVPFGGRTGGQRVMMLLTANILLWQTTVGGRRWRCSCRRYRQRRRWRQRQRGGGNNGSVTPAPVPTL